MKPLKIIIISIFLLGVWNCSSAQLGFYIGGGYNLSYGSYDSLNFIINQYNDTRPFLNQTLDEFKYYHGFTVGAGGYLGPLLIKVDYSGRKQTHHAEGTDLTGIEQRREVRINQNTFGIGLGPTLNLGLARVSPGASLTFGEYLAETRVAPKSDIDNQAWMTAVTEEQKNLEVFLQMIIGSADGIGIRLMLEPYYSIALSDVDITDLNKAINPVSSLFDPSPITINPSYFGLRGSLIIFLGI